MLGLFFYIMSLLTWVGVSDTKTILIFPDDWLCPWNHQSFQFVLS